MTKKENILIYYHRNVKKYSTLTILRFILDIQQRFIGAIFVLILLVKQTPLIAAIYWGYIIYFYKTSKNARQLKITNIFIAVVTMLQYTIILMQQKVTDEESEYILISYVYKVTTGKSPVDFQNNFLAFFTIFGINNLKQNTILYDSIPTVLFQITIFYYDYFLLFCAERLETVLLRIEQNIFMASRDAQNRVLYLVDFKQWKDTMGRVLLSIISICTVRLIEISVVILLILNMFQAKPIWNFARLIILFMIYGNTAFRTLAETDVVRSRLKFVLSLSIMYLWIRVISISFISVITISLPNSGFSKSLKILEIETFEKFILVIEFFVMEYLISIYFSQSHQDLVNKTIKKKRTKAALIAQCMSYDSNEEKLLKYIQGFSERIALEKDISGLTNVIEE